MDPSDRLAYRQQAASLGLPNMLDEPGCPDCGAPDGRRCHADCLRFRDE